MQRLVDQAIEMYCKRDSKGAARLLKETSVMEPSPTTFAQAKAKFRTTADEHSLSNRPQLYHKGMACKPLVLSPRHVRDAIEGMLDTKARGPSGWRSSHAKPLAQDWETLRELTAWSNSWTSGTLGRDIAARWRQVLCIPLNKAEPEEAPKIRPLLLGELLLKVPSVAAHNILGRRAVQALVSTGQYGVGMDNGAECLLAELRSTMQAMKEPVLVRLDVENAFGNGRRATAVEEALEMKELRPLVPLLLSVWALSTIVHMRCGNTGSSSDWDPS